MKKVKFEAITRMRMLEVKKESLESSSTFSSELSVEKVKTSNPTDQMSLPFLQPIFSGNDWMGVTEDAAPRNLPFPKAWADIESQYYDRKSNPVLDCPRML
ncbi:hypothetical protein ACTXT7_006286 [Hymenolepis weldensis]